MAVLFITCGVQGAGKTTLAKRVEKEHRAIRLTPDDWLRELFPEQRTDVGADVRTAIETLHWSIAVRALEIGCNAVLDFGVRQVFFVRVAPPPVATPFRDTEHDFCSAGWEI